jgi:hypothetical protein
VVATSIIIVSDDGLYVCVCVLSSLLLSRGVPGGGEVKSYISDELLRRVSKRLGNCIGTNCFGDDGADVGGDNGGEAGSE